MLTAGTETSADIANGLIMMPALSEPRYGTTQQSIR